MKIFSRVFILFILLLAQTGFALAAATHAVIGRWVAAETLPDGGKLETTVFINPNSRFRGLATLNGQTYMTFSGTWELKEGQILWTYEETSRPIPDEEKLDVDDVLSSKTDELVLRSHLSGKVHTYTRLQ